MFKWQSFVLFHMHSNPKPPDDVINAFFKLQADLGGKFTRQQELHARVYKSLVYARDRVNDKNHITRVMLLGPGPLLIHYHEKVTEKLTIVELFDGAYGHLFYPGHHRNQLEKHCGTTFTFKPFEPHGIMMPHGHLLAQVEITGEFDVKDVHWSH